MKVLFLCSANVWRSQMAEEFFKKLAPEHEVFSAGVNVSPENEGRLVSTGTQKIEATLGGAGIDTSNNKINQLTSEMVDEADKVVALIPKETLPEYLQKSPKLEIWDVDDPGGKDMEAHFRARDEVRRRVEKFVKELNQ